MNQKFKEIIVKRFADQVDVANISNLKYSGDEKVNLISFEVDGKQFQVEYTTSEDGLVEVSNELVEVKTEVEPKTEEIPETAEVEKAEEEVTEEAKEQPEETQKTEESNEESQPEAKEEVSDVVEAVDQDSDELNANEPEEAQETETESIKSEVILDSVKAVVEDNMKALTDKIDQMMSIISSFKSYMDKDNKKSTVDNKKSENTKETEENTAEAEETVTDSEQDNSVDNAKSFNKLNRDQLIAQYGPRIGFKKYEESLNRK